MGEMQKNNMLIILPRVDSTNTYAKNNFHDLADGCVVSAVEQYAGRGRLGRKWFSPANLSLCSTAVLKNISKPFHAGVIVGLAGLELIKECIPESFVFFKWPNDIYVNECKIAGILSEGVLEKGKLSGVVSGVGINVNQNIDELISVNSPATSLAVCSGEKFFLEKLRFELAEKIKKYYIMYQSCPGDTIGLWRNENRLIGENLVLILPDGRERQGCFTGIGEDGEMILKSPDGEFFSFDCGDVKIDVSLIDFNSLSNNYKPM
ncbi:MAG: biotin--[acetyl-CoA-carboxylase] ligase [Lentisphaeria bacterium]|nr:biotin--[acetyl-CoA-carboxylase] ligase [Lentisphaeria bacterium]